MNHLTQETTMFDLMIRMLLDVQHRATALLQREDRGQTTAEYALVMLGAAGVAMLLLGWATRSGAIGKLFDVVLSGIVGKVK
ncbi:MAG: DUF4244 domain-containing protein [Acidobacteria bacterium]|nr:DUF4244 domain-containing protein [Acidobacteriota bacterium]